MCVCATSWICRIQAVKAGFDALSLSEEQLLKMQALRSSVTCDSHIASYHKYNIS